MPAAFRGDADAAVIATGTPLTAVVAFATVEAGAALIIAIQQEGVAARTFVVTDSVSGGTGWVKLVDYGDGGPEIWGIPNHAGGSSVNVTITHNSSTGDFRCTGARFSGLGSTFTTAASDFLQDAASTTNHTSSASGVTGVGDTLAIVAGGFASTLTSTTPGTGYTKMPEYTTGPLAHYAAWKLFPSGCSGEVGAWTSGTSRQCRNAIALLTGTAAEVVRVYPRSTRRRLPGGLL